MLRLPSLQGESSRFEVVFNIQLSLMLDPHRTFFPEPEQRGITLHLPGWQDHPEEGLLFILKAST
jgi:hypothetical protein